MKQNCEFGLRFEDQLPDVTWNQTATSLNNNSISLTLYEFISVDYTFDTKVSPTIVSLLRWITTYQCQASYYKKSKPSLAFSS